MHIEALPTPCVLVDRPRLQRNLARMQDKANAQGVRLRPHTKTHKSIALAQMQVDAGAQGLTVAKTGEAEVFVEAGFDDVRLAYCIVGTDKHQRLLNLMDRARISFCVDTPAGAQAASDFYDRHGHTAEVLVEVDGGYGRCGVRWDDPDAVDFVRFVAGLPGLRLVGLLTHAGQSYHGPQDLQETAAAALQRTSREERDRMLHLAARLAEAGVPGVDPATFDLSIGSTPSMRYFENAEQGGFRITEIRPGNYVFNDAIQVGLQVARLDACALSVYTTVISKHRDYSGKERVFLDAGKKVFTSDVGYNTHGFGTLLYSARTMQPLPHAHLDALSEEHGWVHVPGGATLDVGDRVRVVPNHACVVAGMRQELYLVEADAVVGTLSVDALGKVT